MGDFNLNTLMDTDTSHRKIEFIYQQNALKQCIVDPTNFTEHSSSIIDRIFVSNVVSLALSGVGDPFLLQNIQYHCPVYVVLMFSKPVSKQIKRLIWRYNDADFHSFLSWEANSCWLESPRVKMLISTTLILQPLYLIILDNVFQTKRYQSTLGNQLGIRSDIKQKIRQRKWSYMKNLFVSLD